MDHFGDSAFTAQQKERGRYKSKSASVIGSTRRFHSPALAGTEVSKGARYEIGSATGLHGINSEVIGCPRLKVIKAYAEYRRCMVRVQPDRGFGCLGQAMGICAIVHDSVMHGGAAGIVRCPADNRQIPPPQLDLRPLDDL